MRTIYTNSLPNNKLSTFVKYGSLYLVKRAISERSDNYFVGVAEASKRNNRPIVMYLLSEAKNREPPIRLDIPEPMKIFEIGCK